jgi:hypothetical protein
LPDGAIYRPGVVSATLFLGCSAIESTHDELFYCHQKSKGNVVACMAAFLAVEKSVTFVLRNIGGECILFSQDTKSGISVGTSAERMFRR